MIDYSSLPVNALDNVAQLPLFDYSSLDSDTREQLQALAQRGHFHLRRTQEEMLAFGDVLLEAKELLPHGQLRAWVAAEYGIPDSTITYIMHKARIRKSELGNANISISPETTVEQPVEPVEEVEEVRISRTTNEEKRQTVEQFFSEFPDAEQLSNREIAKRCGVDEKLVRKIRKELFPEPEPEPTPEQEEEIAPVQTIIDSTAHVDNTPTPEPEQEQALEEITQVTEVTEPILEPEVEPEQEPVEEEEVKPEPEVSKPTEKSATLTALQSSESNEWYTPARYIYAARELMGGIDLDPASCEQANKTVKAARIYDSTSNGLDPDNKWDGCVWLNPPYGFTDGKSNQEVWTNRLIVQFKSGITKEAVLLVNANTEAKWFQPLYDFPICFTDHRIRFYSDGEDDNQPTQGNAFIYFGPKGKNKDFKDIFSKFGPIGTFERVKADDNH